MPLYRITTKMRKDCNGIRIEPGMSVQISTQCCASPVNAGPSEQQKVADAFMNVYGIDLRRAGALNAAYLQTERIG